ncbi:HAD family hydrolase [Reinekea blandensis]|uniref:Histidinol-phosphatase n=1 Tax=Reinekea blandensis MED297 TaxID=314283 RepID=A4BAG3_9GAMM|nr:HAD family hydrolase [Reinekea blandensis]EAR10919.1 HAD-superfamily hydrolase, subfamily IB (PSPase-like):HAD-superfamily subfamily IB hydrolase [Reinekea sp. MED297] [Reinekea blandensis MED297]
MTLAIFDLDNTLINGDSDHAWSEFLVAKQLVDAEEVARVNNRFYQHYQNGTLNILEYLEFALSFLKDKTPAELAPIHQQFMAEVIEPMMLPAALALIDKHRQQHHQLLIITATNRFVTEPIAHRLGIENIIACEPEIQNGVYTGHSTGIPSFQQGKVDRLNQWLDDHQLSLDGAWFYSDSHNDLPLLERVDNPVAVNPDDRLRQIAESRGWPLMDLRTNS